MFRKLRANYKTKKLLTCIQEGSMDSLLFVLLSLMSLTFCINKEYRKNIKDFSATYEFKDQLNQMYVVAKFNKNKLKISKKKVSNPTFTLIFKDGKALYNLLMADNPDVIKAVLDQEISFVGNVNYVNKLAFMAMRIKLMVQGKR